MAKILVVAKILATANILAVSNFLATANILAVANIYAKYLAFGLNFLFTNRDNIVRLHHFGLLVVVTRHVGSHCRRQLS